MRTAGLSEEKALPTEWSINKLILIEKGKGDIQECRNYIKLMSHYSFKIVSGSR